MTKSLYIGRFQPFHARHEAIVRKLLGGSLGLDSVSIGIRDTPFNPDNPYSMTERLEMIYSIFGDEIAAGSVTPFVMPDFDQLAIGRKLGWDIVEIELEEDEIPASGSRLRKAIEGVIWITGRPNSGKTTLGLALQKRLGRTILLDADWARKNISRGLTLTDEDRIENNRRIANLAADLSGQGFTVIGATVSPTSMIRKAIDAECKPAWIYVHRTGEINEPENFMIPYDSIPIDMSNITPEVAAGMALEKLARER